jgi:hypothetical protein
VHQLVLSPGNAYHFFEEHVTPVVLLLLLILDLLTLLLARREWRNREEHIGKVFAAARLYSRELYEATISREIINADTRICCYWHSLHSSENAPHYEALNKSLIHASKKMHVDVCLITAKIPSRLSAAKELIDGGVKVRFQETLVVSDLRYSLFDDAMTVFGLPESIDHPEKPSRAGVDVPNRNLNALLDAHFSDEWEDAIEYDDYVRYVARKMIGREVLGHKPMNIPAMVAAQLKIPVEDVRRCCDNMGNGKVTEVTGPTAVTPPAGAPDRFRSAGDDSDEEDA